MKRIEYIDLLKGFGILVMVLGHIYGIQTHEEQEYNYIYNYIYAFHMPLFFFISGFLYKRYQTKEFIIRKFKGLIIPYFIFGMLNLLFSYVLVENFSIPKYFERFFFYNHKYIGIGCAIWFLTALFFLEIIFYMIDKISDKYNRKNIIILCLVLILSIPAGVFRPKLPFSITSSLCALPIFYCGYLLRKYQYKINITNYLLPLLCLGISAFTILYNGTISMRQFRCNNYFLFLFNALLTICGYWFIFDKFKINKYTQYLQYIGQNSLYYMCLNQVFIYLFIKTFMLKNSFLVFCLSISLLYITSKIINKLKKMKGIMLHLFP